MNMRVTLAAGILALSASAASAVTVTVIDASRQTAGNDANVYGADYGANTPVGATWTAGDPSVTPPPGNASNTYQSPFDNTPVVDSATFFSVGGIGAAGGSGSPNTLNLNLVGDSEEETETSINMLWGSIDTYNTLEFLLGGSVVHTITGTMLCNDYAAISVVCNPVALNSGNYDAVALLNFSGMFDALRFTSNTAAFEFGLQAVPVPAAGFLLLAGLGGLAALKRRKKA